MTTPDTSYLIRRLERLTRLRVDRARELNELGFRILDAGLAGTYRDLCDLGRREQAEVILHGLAVRLASGGGL